jgi:anti-sigma regulatory factor (Ser/Thr protein kinase)
VRNHGSGLANMRERLAEVGGTLAVRSSPGAGTRVVGRVPLTPEPPAVAPDAPATDVVAGDDGSAIRGQLIYERLLPGLPHSISRMRGELLDALERRDLAATRRADIALVMSEAATNAVLHAYPPSTPGPVYVLVTHVGRSLLVTVADAGRGVGPDPERRHGMGFMTRFSDQLRIASGVAHEGASIEATFELEDPPGPEAGRPATSHALAHEYLGELVAVDDPVVTLAQAERAIVNARLQQRDS